MSGPTALNAAFEKSIEYSKNMPNTHILSFILTDGSSSCPLLDI